MAPKKRRSLDDDAAAFVFGDEAAPPATTKQRSPKQSAKPSAKERLMNKSTEKEATTRITIDLSQSLHKKLSLFCAENDVSKADVVRELLQDLLN